MLAAVALLYFRQHDMIYHPHPYRNGVAAWMKPGVVKLEFKTIAGTQSAFYLPRRTANNIPARLWIAFGGNGSLALEWLDLIDHDVSPSDAFLLVEYPGYGESEGYAAIATNRAAADGALAALEKNLGARGTEIESRLSVIGHSFGTAAALDFATRHGVQRIVLIAPFTTLREEGALRVGSLLSHLLIENYDNRANLKKLAERKPPPSVAIFHAVGDDIIPVRMGRELAASQPDMVEFFPIDGGDHLSPLHNNADEIVAWMNR